MQSVTSATQTPASPARGVTRPN